MIKQEQKDEIVIVYQQLILDSIIPLFSRKTFYGWIEAFYKNIMLCETLDDLHDNLGIMGWRFLDQPKEFFDVYVPMKRQLSHYIDMRNILKGDK